MLDFGWERGRKRKRSLWRGEVKWARPAGTAYRLDGRAGRPRPALGDEGKAMRPGVFRDPFVEPLSGRVVGDEVVPHLVGEEDEVSLAVADDPMAVWVACAVGCASDHRGISHGVPPLGRRLVRMHKRATDERR